MGLQRTKTLAKSDLSHKKQVLCSAMSMRVQFCETPYHHADSSC